MNEELKTVLRCSKICTTKRRIISKEIMDVYLRRKVLFNQIRQICITQDTYEYNEELEYTVKDFNEALYGGPNEYSSFLISEHLKLLLYMSE